jgi:hypothetical protein
MRGMTADLLLQAPVTHWRGSSGRRPTIELTDEDEGKEVVRSDDSVGRVVEVDRGTAYVDPDPGITETIKSKLGWGDRGDEDTDPLQEASIESVTDDQIRLEE